MNYKKIAQVIRMFYKEIDFKITHESQKSITISAEGFSSNIDLGFKWHVTIGERSQIILEFDDVKYYDESLFLINHYNQSLILDYQAVFEMDNDKNNLLFVTRYNLSFTKDIMVAYMLIVNYIDDLIGDKVLHSYMNELLRDLIEMTNGVEQNELN